MNKESADAPMVSILAPHDRTKPAEDLAARLSALGFLVVIQPIDFQLEKDYHVITGGGSPQSTAIVVDLGPASNARVLGLLKYCPELEGRLIVIGEPEEGLKGKRVIFCERQKAADEVERLIRDNGE